LDWVLVLQVDSSDSDMESAVKQTVAIIETRLNAIGVGTYQLDAKDAANGRFRVGLSLARVPDTERLKKIITANGHLELMAVLSPPSPAPVQTFITKEEAEASLKGRDRAGVRILPYTEEIESTPADNSDSDVSRKPKKWVLLASRAIVDGNELRTARAISLTGRDYQIEFTLKREGAEKFGAWTAANIRNYLGVVLNDEVKSIAFINSQISDTGEIRGKLTKQSAEDLALVLQSGALPAPVKIVNEGFIRWK
jgi:protein-export membrane protein SecD